MPGLRRLVPIPPLSGTMPVAPVKTDADTAQLHPTLTPAPANPVAQSHRGLHRNLLILGSVALLVLGGLGFFIASRQQVDSRTSINNTNNEIIHNTYFQNLIATGRTTALGLEGMAVIRPLGDGFIGLTLDTFGNHSNRWASGRFETLRKDGARALKGSDSSAMRRHWSLWHLRVGG